MAAVVQNIKMGLLNKTDIANLALTNQYQVTLNGFSGELKNYIARQYGVTEEYLKGGIGIMCSEASLPTSSFATSEVKDNFQGINQQFAHTRIYIESDFTFYIDRDYNVLKFFEGWMDYIAGDNKVEKVNKTDEHKYYRRFNYPMNGDSSVGYKAGTLSIAKFDRNVVMGSNQDKNLVSKKFLGNVSKDHGNIIVYEFINAFPKGMTSIPISYGGADILKVNVQFAYDRYLLG